MRFFKYIFFACSLVVSFTACKKYLDIVPKGKIIPEKTNDYRLLLDQMGPLINSFSNDVLMADDIQVNDFSASYYDAASQNVLMFAEHIYQDFESDPDWEALYNQIYLANLVVNEVMDSKEGTEAQQRELMAQARVHRAHAFLILVNLYAKQYNAASADTDPGVPLRLGLDFEENLVRASVKDVYDFILNDLLQASEDLPAAPVLNFINRPCGAAADALLARAYLYMNDIPKALQYSDASLEKYNKLVDYRILPPSTSFPGGLQYPVNLLNEEALLLKSTVSNAPLFYASQGLMSLYDLDKDLRIKALYFSDALFGLSYGYISAEWSGRTPFKGPSTPEMYLTRAECNARLKKVPESMEDLNHLRSFRYPEGSSYALSAATPEEALALVKAERRRELAFRGFRLFDVKRYNEFDSDAISIMHSINGKDYTLSPGSPRWALPIGRKYIDLNPEIKQNPR